MNDSVSEIKSKLDIADVIGKYVKLDRMGSRFRALCPFHQENSPSFYVSPDLGIFKCFGCGESGDIFTFIEKIERVDFVEALKMLAEDAGVQLRKFQSTADYKKRKILKERLFDLNNSAVRLFERFLWESDQNLPRDYILLKRKIPEPIVRKFRLGAVPESQSFLSERLLRLGFSQKEIIEGGFGFPSKYAKHGVVDRFRGRIILPTRDERGRFVGITSRIVENFTSLEQVARSGKYVNSPESPIFKKSDILFGLFESKEKIREVDEVIIVEGQFDVLSAHSAGIENVVCSSGTGISENQVKKLGRIARNIIVFFDNDEAGAKARFRLAEMATNIPSNFFAILAKQKDLDEFLQSGGDFKELKKQKEDLFEFVIKEKIITSKDLPHLEKEKVLDDLAKLIFSLRISHRERLLGIVMSVGGKYFPKFSKKTFDKNNLESRVSKVTNLRTKLDNKSKFGTRKVQDLEILAWLVFSLKSDAMEDCKEFIHSLQKFDFLFPKIWHRLKLLLNNQSEEFWKRLSDERSDEIAIKRMILDIEDFQASGGNLCVRFRNLIRKHSDNQIRERIIDGSEDSLSQINKIRNLYIL